MKEFIGIVEDLEDPLNLGRVKVRVVNEHDANISTDDLKWAHVMMPVTSGSYQGVGDTPCLVTGSKVLGFYMDAEEKQLMMILGSFPVIPDMDHDKHSLSYLARGKQILEKNVVGPEPESAFGAQYPYNRVISSRSGHVIEIDDTPENERIHIYHKSGSYTEINKDGRVVNKSVNDNYEIVQNNKTLHIEIEGDFPEYVEDISTSGDEIVISGVTFGHGATYDESVKIPFEIAFCSDAYLLGYAKNIQKKKDEEEAAQAKIASDADALQAEIEANERALYEKLKAKFG